MKYVELAKPCRNFCTFRSFIKIVDPKDNREKFAFGSLSQSDNGKLIIFDPLEKKFESYDLQLDCGVSGLAQLPDGSIMCGTIMYFGSFQRFDMLNRRWYKEPLYIDGETYLWTLSVGTDKKVYGGTWRGNKLLCYDPSDHTIIDLGKTSNDIENNYAHDTFSQIPGRIYVSNGQSAWSVSYYDIETGTMHKDVVKGGKIISLNTEFMGVLRGVDVDILDPLTFESLIEEPIKESELRELAKSDELIARYLKCHFSFPLNYIRTVITPKFGEMAIFGNFGEDGNLYGTQGQEAFCFDVKNEEFLYFTPINCEAPPTFIHTLASDDETIWGCDALGLTIFHYNPKDGSYNNTLSISTGGGEVYGMVCHDEKVYLTAYAYGESVVYDPKQPWSMRDNKNPKRIHEMRSKYVRPITDSVIDDENVIWTGWSAAYGNREMCITRWDTETDKVTLFEKLVPNRTVYGLDVTKEHVWFTTYFYANGLPDKLDEMYICAMDKEGNLIFKQEFPKGVRLGRVCFSGRYGLFQADNDLYRIDDEAVSVEKISGITLHNKGARNMVPGDNLVWRMLKYDNSTVIVFDTDHTLFVDVNTMQVTKRVKSPDDFVTPLIYPGVHACTMCGDKVYVSVGSKLYVLEE